MKNENSYYTKAQFSWLLVLRIFIGWHFLYEGTIKILNPKWTSLPYLMDSKGFASSLFTTLAEQTELMKVINFCNEWALALIGLGLILGCFARLASVGGMILLSLYTLSHPSFVGANYMMPFEGSYLWVDKNMIELVALGVLLCFPTSHVIGIDRILIKCFPSLRKIKMI